LNDLQSVAWTVEHELIGVFREIIELDTESRLTGGGSGGALSLTISDDGKTCIVKAGKNLEAQCPVGDGSNTLEWIRELDQAEWMCNDVDIDGRFHHVWHFDYRGRMYTASPRLSPIGDDLSRGLLRFAESQPLNSRGWYWLQVYTAGLWEGRKNGSTGVPIPGAPTEKTFEAFYEAAQNPEFIEELRKVVRSPVNTFDIWGEGDSLRSKAEGFLRLNATIAFIEALDEGGKGALCNLPVVQDASSNVYQHMSAIIRDADMAKEVNVLPNEAGGRADVYMKVAEVAKVWLENDDFKLPDKVKMPSGKQRKLSEEEKGDILEVIKRYVMDEKEGSRFSYNRYVQSRRFCSISCV
jgi:DNA-directed RNA polymerase